ncbi:Hypothetical predicted protein [Paramuricea clavata]|uniref:Uncharacterized protein n=1 Tax=Paramuricea clavata TaxID=317549 RepID=A0A7D9EI99_PARCT|nr:Hypothetical predicted protein [Paramuricea clavata]
MSKFEACKVSLVIQLKEIEKLDGDITELVDEENIEREIFERCDFEAVVQEVICRLNSFVAEKRVMKPVGTSVQQGSQIKTNTQREVNVPDVETTNLGMVNR